MKAVGIVVEYNPLHNGHLYHIQKAKELSGADVVIAVMSGNFLQRGEMAIVDKWARAQMALTAGVDIVVELPIVFATQKADTFASAAVSLLQEMQCTSIAFGSEHGDSASFIYAAKAIENNRSSFEEVVKRLVKEGKSYAAATGIALQTVSDIEFGLPNNILGFQYVLSIVKNKWPITPITFMRKGTGYYDLHADEESDIASATGIRQSIFTDGKLLEECTPGFVQAEIEYYQRKAGCLHSWDTYWPILQYKILSSSAEQLQRIYTVNEGIENRLLQAAESATSFTEFMESVKTKRYTWTRLQRICCYILLSLETSSMAGYTKPNYLRLLGMSTAGQQYLRQYKKSFSLPIVTKLSDYKEKEYLENIRLSKIYYQVLQYDKREKMLQQEYTAPIFRR